MMSLADRVLATLPRKSLVDASVHQQALDEADLTHVELALRTLEGDDAQLAFFRDLAAKARERKWRPGAVNHRFREKFGELPPLKWWNALRRGFKADAEWVAAVEAKAPPAPPGPQW